MINSQEEAVLYPRGFSRHFSCDLEIQEELSRRMVEKVDNLEGFQFFHAASGGSGSGQLAKLAELLSVNYGKKPKLSYTLWPSQNYSTSIVEPYNTILCGHCLIEHVDLCMLIDNESLYKICENRLGL